LGQQFTERLAFSWSAAKHKDPARNHRIAGREQSRFM
jgi:hypothetical protein